MYTQQAVLMFPVLFIHLFKMYCSRAYTKNKHIDNAETYILQDDSSILCYNRNGNFIEKYNLNLAEQGLTASKIACSNGTIYLLDGHNNAIITAEKDKIKNVSVLNFTDVGMVKNFFAQKKEH